MAKPSPAGKDQLYVSKKCHECYEYVPLDAKACPYCKTRLGKIGPNGMAEKLTDWKGYFICIVLWLILAIYVKWAFF
jgi:RNA polymerase subunit RPABC4/transcription elongation factor Spt4